MNTVSTTEESMGAQELERNQQVSQFYQQRDWQQISSAL